MGNEELDKSPKKVDGIRGFKKPKQEALQAEEKSLDTPAETQATKKSAKRKWNFKLPKINFNKRILLIILWAILLVVFAAAGFYYFNSKKKAQNQPEVQQEKVLEEAEPRPEDNVVYVQASEGLRLREFPSYASKTITTLPFQAKLIVLEEQSGWYKVRYEDKEGWCYKFYTTAERPKELSIRDLDFSKIITVKEGLNEIQSVNYDDYNKDGREEALVSVLYDGSGGYKEFYVYGYKDGLVLTKYLDLRPSTEPDAFVSGYMGHDSLDYFAVGRFVLSYPLYKKEDPNCCPTGGKQYIYFKWDGKEFILESKTSG